MAKENAVELERFRIPCSAVKRLGIIADESLGASPNRLIGYTDYIDVFRSLVPLAAFDDSGEVSDWDDFNEIFPDTSFAGQTTGAAVLFSGKGGCGRHTADKTLMSTAISCVENTASAEDAGDDMFGFMDEPDPDDYIHIYQIDLRAFAAFTERALARTVDDLFDELIQTAVSAPKVIHYYSLGNVTALLKSEKLAPRFLYRVEQLKSNAFAHCIVTCIFDGDASTLPEEKKTPFFVLDFDLPDTSARTEYLSYLCDRYLNIQVDYTAEELAEKTKGFTFAMIKKLGAHMMMAVKNEIIEKGLDPKNYVHQATINKLEVLIVDKKKIDAILKQIGGTKYVAPVSQDRQVVIQPVPGGDSGTAGSGDSGTQTPQPSDQNETPDGELSHEELAKAMVKKIDKPDDITRLRDGMLVPTGYGPAILMNHGMVFPDKFREKDISLPQFLRRCRELGYLSLDNIKTASVDPRTGEVELFPNDEKALQPTADVPDGMLFGEVIMEGQILEAHLQSLGHDDDWLGYQLRRKDIASPKEIFLAVCKSDGELVLYAYK